MTTPDRLTTSTTPFRASTPRHIPGPPLPSKRWYFSGSDGAVTLLVCLLCAALVPAVGFVVCGLAPWVMRATGVVVGFLAQWCLAFVRRSATPPRGAVILGGDDE